MRKQHTEETKRKISETLKAKGITPWNKGKKHTSETKQKISESLKRRYKEFKHPLEGYKFSDESKQKMRDSMSEWIAKNPNWRTGKNNPFWGCLHTDESKEKISQSQQGEKHHNWKGGCIYYRGGNWRLQRNIRRKKDGFKCQLCSVPESDRAHDVHHIIPFDSFNDYKEANKIDNLITLCFNCHRKVTWNSELLDIKVTS